MSPLQLEFECPYCGFPNFSPVDPISGLQEWTSDCENCCQPITLKVRVRHGEIEEWEAGREQD
jgi:transcription elongation factor Elf1